MTEPIEKISRNTILRRLNLIFIKFEPFVTRAFKDATKAIRNKATLELLTKALEEGNMAEAINLVGADTLTARLRGVGLPPGQKSMEQFIQESYAAGQVMGQRALPTEIALQTSLDLTNPETVKYLTRTLPQRIAEIGSQQELAVRDAVLRGFTEGRTAPQVAQEIRQSIGLTVKQSEAVGNFRRQLETGQLGNAQAPWKRRLSAVEQSQARSIFNSAAAGRPVDPKRVERLVTRYQSSLVNKRAKDISRSEINFASGEGQSAIWDQADRKGLIDHTRARRFWIVTPDEALRADHASVPGRNPDGVKFREPFRTAVGPVMRPRTSGVKSFDINCRCAEALEFLPSPTLAATEATILSGV